MTAEMMEDFHRGTTFPLIINIDLDFPSTLSLFTIFVNEKLSETEISMTLWEQGKVLLAGITTASESTKTTTMMSFGEDGHSTCLLPSVRDYSVH